MTAKRSFRDHKRVNFWLNGQRALFQEIRMIVAPIPENDLLRLAALRRYDVLDTAAEPAFDRLTALAQAIMDVPTVLVSLVDANRQWFKSRIGLDATETPRDISFCGHAVFLRTTLIVCDASQNPRFADNPLVTGALGLRYYVGVPLITPDGHALGTLCVIDYKPRPAPSATQLDLLNKLADTVVAALEMRSLARHHQTKAAISNLMRQLAQTSGLHQALPLVLHDLSTVLGLAGALVTIDQDRTWHINQDGEGHEALQQLTQHWPDTISASSQHPHQLVTLTATEGNEDDVSRLALTAGITHRLHLTLETHLQEPVSVDLFASGLLYPDVELLSIGRQVHNLLTKLVERERLEHIKNNFVNTVSHELRTPLTSIAASLELLNHGQGGELPPKAAKMLQIAHRNCVRLSGLVNDILDIGKLESGGLSIECLPSQLYPLIHQAVQDTTAYAAPFGVQFDLTDCDTTCSANVDPNRFMQVIINLLSNATKFSPTGGTVTIGMTPVGDQIRISVSDQGTGIPDAFKPHVFERFAQAGSTDRRQQGGSGLGLAIAKGLVERFAGAISFESSATSGTTFWVDLPAIR